MRKGCFWFSIALNFVHARLEREMRTKPHSRRHHLRLLSKMMDFICERTRHEHTQAEASLFLKLTLDRKKIVIKIKFYIMKVLLPCSTVLCVDVRNNTIKTFFRCPVLTSLTNIRYSTPSLFAKKYGKKLRMKAKLQKLTTTSIVLVTVCVCVCVCEITKGVNKCNVWVLRRQRRRRRQYICL